jgi:hypothetical protein
MTGYVRLVQVMINLVWLGQDKSGYDRLTQVRPG